MYIKRDLQKKLEKTVSEQKSILLLGPRQTGKTTLIDKLAADLCISFIQPRERLRYEVDASILNDEITALAEDSKKQPLVIIDEVQKVPLIMDVAQDLIDRKVAQLLLTGSSARKLRHGKQVNLLPGRVIPMRMDALNIAELSTKQLVLDEILTYGTLPKIVLSETIEEKEELLDAYISIYLEEEVRAEALVRNVASFACFLELAASESGYVINNAKLSQAIGVAATTIANYFQILEDCLIIERLEPITASKTRHKLSKTEKYVFFDLGVRRLAAREGDKPSLKQKGHLFEQFIILECIKLARLQSSRIKIKYWHDPGGPEVDCVIDTPDQMIPIKIRHTEKPNKNDGKHLLIFLNEYPTTEKAYIVCRTPRKMKLTERLYAIPWQDLPQLF